MLETPTVIAPNANAVTAIRSAFLIVVLLVRSVDESWTIKASMIRVEEVRYEKVCVDGVDRARVGDGVRAAFDSDRTGGRGSVRLSRDHTGLLLELQRHVRVLRSLPRVLSGVRCSLAVALSGSGGGLVDRHALDEDSAHDQADGKNPARQVQLRDGENEPNENRDHDDGANA